MATTLNYRNFPADLLHRVKVEAAKKGVSQKELHIRALQEYLERRRG